MEYILFQPMVEPGTNGMSVSKVKTSYTFPLEKILIERTMKYVQDRNTESLDDFPCRNLENFKLKYDTKWLNVIVDYN